MANFYLPISQRTRESIKKDPTKFIEDLTNQIKTLGCEDFHYTVNMSPYPNPIHRLWNYIVSFFNQTPIKTISLYDLDKVREYHGKKYPLEFNSKTGLSIPESAILLTFKNNGNSYLIDFYREEIEVTAHPREGENEEVITDECERLLFDVFGRSL
jgi:hypothetical protein